MLKILKTAIVVLMIVACSESQSQGGLFINELVFEVYDNNKLDFIEVYNSGADSVSLSSAYLMIDSLKIDLKKLSGVNGGEYAFQKIKGRIKNKKFKAQLFINNEVVDEIEWNGLKKAEFIGRFPDGKKTYRLGSRSLGRTNNSGSIKISKPAFELKEGNYNAPQKLVLKQEYSNVSMYYTFDGSNPNKKSEK